jgi:hypothetical protein
MGYHAFIASLSVIKTAMQVPNYMRFLIWLREVQIPLRFRRARIYILPFADNF